MKARVENALSRYSKRDAAPEPPPAVPNKNLLTLARGEEQFRLDYCVWNGASFISARIWSPARDGSGFRPTHRGCTIRQNEVSYVRDALEAAQREFGRDDAEA